MTPTLKLELAGRDPNEGTSDVAYEKGRWFLGFLESASDGPRSMRSCASISMRTRSRA